MEGTAARPGTGLPAAVARRLQAPPCTPSSCRRAPHDAWNAPASRQSRWVAAPVGGSGSGSGARSSIRPAPAIGRSVEGAVSEMQARLRTAVLAEQAEQQRQQVAAYSRTSAQRVASEGLALLGLLAAPRGRLYGEFVWAFTMPGGAPLPYHRFRQGATVLLASMGGPGTTAAAQQRRQRRDIGSGSGSDREVDDGSQGLEGTVLEVGREQVMLSVPKELAEALGAALSGTPWRLDQGTSCVTARRQLAAIASLPRVSDPASKGETAVRALLLGASGAERVAALPTSWAQQQDWRAAAGAELQKLEGLNASQERAVATALTRTLTLWQGPPGTGKTRTLLALMEVLVRTAASSPQHRLRQGPLLAVADTNAAADNLLEGLLARGIDAVRVGQPAKVRPELRHACVDARAERSPQGQRAAKLRADADRLLQAIRQGQQQLAAIQRWQGQQAEERRQGMQQGQGERQGGRQAQASLPAQQQQQQQQRQGQGVPVAQRLQDERQQQMRALEQQKQQGAVQAREQAALQARHEEARQQGAALEAQVKQMQRQVDDIWRTADELVAGEARVLLQYAPVVVATCNGAGEGRLEGRQFRVVVLDEASQATEASSLVPLVKGAQCVVMAGDQRQLPPTVLSRKALDLGLDVPLFTRLLGMGVSFKLLDRQYRMHPAIAEFPSAQFYNGQVLSGVTAAERPPVQGVPWTNPSCPVLFVNVDGSEQRASGGSAQRRSGGAANGSGSDSDFDGGSGGGGGSGSYSNRAEAEVVMKVVQRVLEQDESLQSMALLSPYSGQVRLLSELLRSAPLPQGATERCPITVSTVDGYQGREADCVVFSAVRCNRRGRVGFLADERRLNVAITRPRRGLIVVGNQATLASDPNWAAWMGWVAGQRKQRSAGVAAGTAAPVTAVGEGQVASAAAGGEQQPASGEVARSPDEAASEQQMPVAVQEARAAAASKQQQHPMSAAGSSHTG